MINTEILIDCLKCFAEMHSPGFHTALVGCDDL